MIIKRFSTLRCCLYSETFRNYSKKTAVSKDVEQYFEGNLDLETLEKNALMRNHENNVPFIRSLVSDIEKEKDVEEKQLLKIRLGMAYSKLPNATHPRIMKYGTEPKEIFKHEFQSLNTPSVLEFSEICKRFHTLRTEHLSNFNGHKSYYLSGLIAELEHFLIQYALKSLKIKQFKMLSVPDILPKEVIENCGMQTDGERTQVYKIDSKRCLSGTSEMALAGFYENSLFEETDLPIKVAAVSRCYRAETSGLQEEKGIYRVHNFTKVEMFAICSENQSEDMIEQFKDIQIELFKGLGLTFKLLDMPPSELGASAYQKYDIEAWMPGRGMWGEISSCSNCTDYQSKRLGLKYRCSDGQLKYAHTINGTAAAIPRLLIAMIETNQNNIDGLISLENGDKLWTNSEQSKRNIPELKLAKIIKLEKT